MPGLPLLSRVPKHFVTTVTFTGAANLGGSGTTVPIATVTGSVLILHLSIRLAVVGCNGFVRAALRMSVVDRSRMTEEVRAGVLAPYASRPERIAIGRFVLDIPMRPHHPSYATLAGIEARLPELADRPSMFI